MISVIGQDGTKLNRGNLPPSDTKRWVKRLKGQVVAAVRGGLLSMEDACHRYSLTAEEFQAWQGQALRAVQGSPPIVSGNTAADANIAMLHKRGSGDARAAATIHAPNGHAPSFITAGNFTIDLDAKTVDVGSSRLDLTCKEYEVMQLLAMYKGTTLSKEMVTNRLYGCTNARTRNLVHVFICKLRNKIAVACGGGHCIRTVWGRGYMLREDVSESPEEYRFNAEEWIKLSPSKRMHRCRVMALEARKLAQNASGAVGGDYVKIADNWDQLAADIGRNGGTRSHTSKSWRGESKTV